MEEVGRMKTPAPFLAGLPSGKVNVAVQRPTVNVKEAENEAEQGQAAADRASASVTPLGPGVKTKAPSVTFSKHGTFGPKRITHPGLEED